MSDADFAVIMVFLHYIAGTVSAGWMRIFMYFVGGLWALLYIAYKLIERGVI